MNQALSGAENQRNNQKRSANEAGYKALEVLGQIARGREDCGKPYNAEEVRQMARTTLLSLGLRWPQNSTLQTE